MLLDKLRSVRRTLAFRLTLWYAGVFTASSLSKSTSTDVNAMSASPVAKATSSSMLCPVFALISASILSKTASAEPSTGSVPEASYQEGSLRLQAA